MEQFRDRVKEVAIIVTAVREGATASMIMESNVGVWRVYTTGSMVI
jgi:hypothetical protein